MCFFFPLLSLTHSLTLLVFSVATHTIVTFVADGRRGDEMTDTDGLRETPHPSSVADGMGGPNLPSVIRSGWYRKMGLGIRGRTDRYGHPKTDRTVVHRMDQQAWMRGSSPSE